MRRFLPAVVLLWLLIGVLAAGQRGYYGATATHCSQAETIAVTVIVGPLNYLGANPKTSCLVPRPSQ